MRFMSSPKAAAAKATRRPTAQARPAGKPTRTPPAAKSTAEPASKAANAVVGSAEAKRFAMEIERALPSGRQDVLSTSSLQPLRASGGRTIGAQAEAEWD